MDASLLYWNEKLGKLVPRQLILQWTVTGANTIVPYPQNSTSFVTVNTAITQAQIDATLNVTSTNSAKTYPEFLAAQFDATSMGTDTIGGVIAMNSNANTGNGQVASILSMDAYWYHGANGATVVPAHVASVATLASTTNSTQIAVGADGNIGFRAILTGLSAGTSGYVELRVLWISK